ncbi:Homocysteine S-methyltransferase [Lasiosphaeris hirsuta]|uniref:Homocysteine S-methyltransferase n=1 Tax=Lasiosphaeris hirsuta TaxID=260670 RepID=A0AA40E8L9_9PEZI|nr:Homocysteine S-methyltransferase [Lasiosphaeris hirsuta]
MKTHRRIPIRILDGGLGTTLEDLFNVRFSAQTPLWSSHLLVTSPKLLMACQRLFALAGADVITTATYNFSIEGFADTKTPDFPCGIVEVARYLRFAILIAWRARPNIDSDIAISLGPYGATMQPSTEYSANYDASHCTTQQLLEWHTKRMACFKDTAAGLTSIKYAFETIPCLNEIYAIKMLFRTPLAKRSVWQPPKTLGWISCVFPGDDDKLPDGTTAEDAVAAMLSCNDMPGGLSPPYPPWGIGINCTKVHKLDSLVRKYETTVQGLIDDCHINAWPSLVLYPDGTNGEVYNPVKKTWELPKGTKPPEIPWEVQLANVVKGTIRRAKWSTILVGGCCKTTPADITRLRKLLIEPNSRRGASESHGSSEVSGSGSSCWVSI